MDIISTTIGVIIGIAVAIPIAIKIIKVKNQGQITEITHQKDIELAACREETRDIKHRLNKQSSENEFHIEQSVQTVSLVLEDSATSADVTSSNLIKIQEQINYLTEMVEQIISLSNQTSETSQAGVDRIDSVVADLSELTKSKQDLSDILAKFKGVQEKTVAIRYIGEEAEMLALNAAIEAARAGDAGRGFAVVATAMKTLAKSSQDTTFEILDIVNNSEQVISQVSGNFVTRGEQLNDSIESLVTNFNEIRASVNTIQNHSKSITHDSSGISNMMKEAAGATNTSAETMLAKLSELVSNLTGKSVSNISVQQAQEDWESFDEVIDVRKAHERDDELGFIEGTRLSTLQTSFKQDVHKLDSKKKYLFVCRSGGRSTKAAQTAIANGVEQVYNLEGGMLEWRKHYSK